MPNNHIHIGDVSFDASHDEFVLTYNHSTGLVELTPPSDFFHIEIFASDADVATGLSTQWVTIPYVYAGWEVVHVSAGTYTQGVTGSTNVELMRRRDTTNVSTMTAPVTIGAEVYAEDGTIDAANDDIAAGDKFGANVLQVHSGTAPQGLTITVHVQKPAS